MSAVTILYLAVAKALVELTGSMGVKRTSGVDMLRVLQKNLQRILLPYIPFVRTDDFHERRTTESLDEYLYP